MNRNATMLVGLLRSWIWALVIALVFGTPVNTALAGPGGTDRPHLGKCDTVIPPPTSIFPAVVEISLTCHFRHLGLTTGTVVQTVNAAGPLSNGVLPIIISDGQIAYIAANGDELYATFEGEGSIDFASGTIAFEGIETYIGGTNRFSHASGSSYLEGHASAITLTGIYVTLGKLTY